MNKVVIDRFSECIKLGKEDSFLKDLVEQGENIKIYRNNYIYNHLGVLINIFAATYKLLGENNFKYFSLQYLTQTLISSENIDLAGDQYPEFLGANIDLHKVPYLKDLSLLELFFFKQNLENELSLPRGVFDLWFKILNNEWLDQVEIQSSQKEIIKLKVNIKGETYMVNTGLPKEG